VLPVFFDRAGGFLRMHLCFDSPVGTLPAGWKVVRLLLSENELTPSFAATPGNYVWRGFFTPVVSGSARPSETVEARSIQPWPGRITLSSTIRRRHGRRFVLLHGRLTEAGHPTAGARIRLEARALPRGLPVVWASSQTTRRDGTFSFRRPLKRALDYIASVAPRDVTARACRGSTAPGGCVHAEIAPPNPAAITVRVPHSR
jgi:hypothetical protein